MDNCNHDSATVFYAIAVKSDQLIFDLRHAACENHRFQLLKRIETKGAMNEARCHPTE
jgi:hypothetical protein